jgi:nucleotide-binding universal stress UspA family protein
VIPAPSRLIRKILVALDASLGSRAALRAAADLAAAMEAELSGVAVEDVELLRFAEAPAQLAAANSGRMMIVLSRVSPGKVPRVAK